MDKSRAPHQRLSIRACVQTKNVCCTPDETHHKRDDSRAYPGEEVQLISNYTRECALDLGKKVSTNQSLVQRFLNHQISELLGAVPAKHIEGCQ